MQEHKALVYEVTDGDTIKVSFTYEFLDVTLTAKARLRLLDINAPELKGLTKPNGLKSKEYMTQRLLGKTITFQTETKDDFGRWLSIVYLDGVNINQEMLDKGLAVSYKRR